MKRGRWWSSSRRTLPIYIGKNWARLVPVQLDFLGYLSGEAAQPRRPTPGHDGGPISTMINSDADTPEAPFPSYLGIVSVSIKRP